MRKGFKNTADIANRYIAEAKRTADRVADLWAYIRDNVADPDATRDGIAEDIKASGASPKQFRNEWNLAVAMGPHADRSPHPYAFTPQMQANIGKVVEAAECSRDEAWDLIVETFPNQGGDFVKANLPKIPGVKKPDAIEAAIALLRDNASDPRVEAFIASMA